MFVQVLNDFSTISERLSHEVDASPVVANECLIRLDSCTAAYSRILNTTADTLTCCLESRLSQACLSRSQGPELGLQHGLLGCVHRHQKWQRCA